jgi:precorrin-6A/cobalt-precorrin-6A reductase
MLDRKKLLDLVQNRGIQLIIDATHPFAENVSRTAMAVCADTGCGYLRYQRKPEPLPENQLIERSPSAEQAAEKLAEEKGNVLLTTGSRSLALFARRIHRDRLFARVLPRSESLGECERCGLLPSHLMAMQGPFDQELNGYLIRRFDVEWMVSKQSGSEGGLREKIAACLEHETKLLVIDPPDLAYSEIVHTTGELIERLNRIIEE